MSVSVIVSAVLLGGMVVTAAAEFDNARAANQAALREASAPLIIAENHSTAKLISKPQLRD